MAVQAERPPLVVTRRSSEFTRAMTLGEMRRNRPSARPRSNRHVRPAAVIFAIWTAWPLVHRIVQGLRVIISPYRNPVRETSPDEGG